MFKKVKGTHETMFSHYLCEPFSSSCYVCFLLFIMVMQVLLFWPLLWQCLFFSFFSSSAKRDFIGIQVYPLGLGFPLDSAAVQTALSCSQIRVAKAWRIAAASSPWYNSPINTKKSCRRQCASLSS